MYSTIVDILINDKIWLKEDSNIESFIKDLVNKIIPDTKLKKLLEKNIELEVSIVLTDNKEIQNLNKIYRNKDKPTNVLSFPALDSDNIENGDFLTENFAAIGDIILSYKTIKEEALTQNKKFHHHLTHLIIHSILHLIGYVHENEDEAKIMEDLEIKLLKKLEIANPYN